MSYDSTHRNSDGITVTARQREGSSAALEIIGVAVLAFAAMGLLTVGYNTRSASEVAQQQSAGVPSTALGATPQTQPRAPGNNTPSAPTSSTTGQGPDNGSTGTPTHNATPAQGQP